MKIEVIDQHDNTYEFESETLKLNIDGPHTCVYSIKGLIGVFDNVAAARIIE